MAQNIAVIGTGYVCLVVAVGLADFGNTLIGVDIDDGKVAKLNAVISTIYEQGIQEYLKRNIKAGRLSFTTGIDRAIQKSAAVFISIGTPQAVEGSAGLSQVESVLEAIARNLNGYKVIVTESTVSIGTNRWIKEELTKKAGDKNFDVVSNPEFLREGRAIQDFFHPESATIKAHDPKAISNFKKLFPEGIHYFDDEFDTVEGADAVVICTDWNEYRNLDLKKMKKHIKGTILIDGRNVLDMEEAKSRGFVYEGVGRR